jgi:hypothetical protein
LGENSSTKLAIFFFLSASFVVATISESTDVENGTLRGRWVRERLVDLPGAVRVGTRATHVAVAGHVRLEPGGTPCETE